MEKSDNIKITSESENLLTVIKSHKSRRSTYLNVIFAIIMVILLNRIFKSYEKLMLSGVIFSKINVRMRISTF